MTKQILSAIAVTMMSVSAFAQQTLWEGNGEIGNWSGSVVVDAEKFINAKEGDAVTIYYTPGEDAPAMEVQIANGGFTVEGFKALPEYTEWNCIFIGGNTSVTFPLTSADITNLAERGMNISGKNFTVTKVVLTPADILWVGDVVLDYNSNKVNIPAGKFGIASVGDKVTLEFTFAEGKTGSDLYVKYNTGEFVEGFQALPICEEWGAWVSSTDPITFALTAQDVEKLKAYGMSISAAPGQFNLKKVTIENSNAGVALVYDNESNETPHYYNILGVEETSPRSGQIYIVVRGDKVAKQLYR